MCAEMGAGGGGGVSQRRRKTFDENISLLQ